MKQRIIKIAALTALTATASLAADEKIVMDGSTTVGPIAKAFAEFFMAKNPNVNITVSESGSGNGAKGILNGTCDIANMSRFMKDTEFRGCVEKGVFPVAHVVALDALPVMVHPSNPVDGLTVAQIRDIFAGVITNWKEVGGPDMPIVVVSRDTNSGTYETFETLVMHGQKISGNAEYVGSNGAIRQRVQSTKGAIGYAGLGFVDATVKPLKVDGVAPTADTAKNGTYPIARPLYMFTNGYPKMGSAVYRFVTFYLTEKGHDIVKEIGFVPVTAY
jgi:phosphate transport system substrate-binding protein